MTQSVYGRWAKCKQNIPAFLPLSLSTTEARHCSALKTYVTFVMIIAQINLYYALTPE